MAGDQKDDSGGAVVCYGPPGAPHPPRRLELPNGSAVRCPECGQTYRRGDAPQQVHPASWPKSDWPDKT